jgi:hypothetical protein
LAIQPPAPPTAPPPRTRRTSSRSRLSADADGLAPRRVAPVTHTVVIELRRGHDAMCLNAGRFKVR